MSACCCIGPRPGHDLCPCRERARDREISKILTPAVLRAAALVLEKRNGIAHLADIRQRLQRRGRATSQG